MSGVSHERFGKALRIVAFALVLIGGGLDYRAMAENGSREQPTTQQQDGNQPRDPYLLHLRGYKFDPAKGAPKLPKDLQITPPPREAAYYIVQFKKSLTRRQRTRMQTKYKLRLKDYIPNHAYLEKVEPKTLKSLEQEKLFRAKVLYQPAFKIDPMIGKVEFRTRERKQMEGLLLSAELFFDGNAASVIKQLQRREIGARNIIVLDNRKLGGALRLRFEVASPERLTEIARIESVRWIEEVPEQIEDNVNTAGTIQSGTAGTTPIWNQGIRGEDQIIGIIDTSPLDINHCFFQDPVDNTPGPAHRKVVDIRNATGSVARWHATFVAGNAAGDDFNNPGTSNQRGSAWASRLISGNLSDISGGLSTMLAELNDAAAMGATIHSNSWHDNTAGAGNPATYNQTSADVDTFTWNNEDHLVLGSAGNNREEQGPPGTAKNAICVGASQNDPAEMSFGDGNAGPTADGRLKPDLFAPGCGIRSATVSTACGTGFRPACATSFATPHAAGTAALIRQYYTEGWYPTGTRQPHHAFVPSGALLKATLLNSTIDMTNVAGYPNNNEGWGLIRANNTLFFPGGARNLQVWDLRHANGLATGDSKTHTVQVQTNGQPLKVTLVWTEPPASSGTANPVINDLDLTVTSPDGTQTFLGNWFAGGVSTPGGAPDTLNNVEMVLVNNPAVGDWTITVSGTAVNVGNPDQGYALVATGDFPEPPPTTGDQDTLVVRVKFADIAFEPPLPNLQNTMAEVVNYFNEVTYGEVTINPMYRGPIQLDFNKDYYYHPERNPLVELTEEVIGKLAPDLFDTVERMIIVSNDPSFVRDWATTGSWPYELPGGLTRPISVSIQSYNNPVARFTHGLGHQFNLVDLYAHEGVVFPRAYVDEWDNMAGLFTNVHFTVWNKERADWISSHGSEVRYVPRPAAGATLSETIGLFNQESTGANLKAIALGLTPGAGTLAQEDVFYFIEARDNTLGGYDDALPESGVLIYYVNELIPQGEGPMIVRDEDLTTASLNDAAFAIGDVHTIPGTGIEIEVMASTGGADYDIQINYAPPETDYNVSITKGETIGGKFYGHFSPDIWVDSPKNGWNLGAGPPPHNDREQPVIGEVNRLYARIKNTGPGTAFDFDVQFRISEPYHTVGGKADFDKFLGIRHIDRFEPSDSPMIVPFIEWTPEEGEPHACLWVEIINLVGNDTNPNDNAAQENLQKVTSSSSSPFHSVNYQYDLTNPYEQPALFYFRAEDVPKGWEASLIPRKVLLDPGQNLIGSLTLTPPPNAKVCTSHLIQVTSWTPRGDTLIPVGGGVVQVDLRRSTAISLDTQWERCRNEDANEIKELILKEVKYFIQTFVPTHGRAANISIPDILKNRCRRIVARGCTDPPAPNQEIIVRYEGPDGEPIYHTAKTDENGCFEDFLVVTEDGDWLVTAEYEGDKCRGPVVSGPERLCWCR